MFTTSVSEKVKCLPLPSYCCLLILGLFKSDLTTNQIKLFDNDSRPIQNEGSVS